MQVNMLKSKIHRATVVQSELDYVGSITVDEELMEAAGINIRYCRRKRFRNDLFKWCSSTYGKFRRQNHHYELCSNDT